MAYKFNTGNPVGPNGSADARDLVDNSQVADRLITSAALTVPDRLGVQRRTWAGINAAGDEAIQIIRTRADYNYRGEWVTATAYQINDIWRDGPTGAFYLVLADYTSGASAAADIAGGNVVVHQPKDWVVSIDDLSEIRNLQPAFEQQLVATPKNGIFRRQFGDWNPQPIMSNMVPSKLSNPQISNQEYLIIDYVDGALWATKNTGLYKSNDMGSTYSVVIPEGSGFSAQRMIPTSDGEVLVLQSGRVVVKSSGWSANPATATFSTVLEVPASSPNSNILRWGIDGDGTKFIANNYGLTGDVYYVWISTDSGSTWQVAYDQSAVTADRSHIHCCCYDRWDDRFYFTYGHGEPCGIYYSDNDGTTWTMMNQYNYSTGVLANFTTMTPTDFGIVCGTDRYPNGVYIIRRSANPDSLKIELAGRWDTARGGLNGFADRGMRDPDTGIVYIGFRSDWQEVPAVIMACGSNGAKVVWEDEVDPVNPRRIYNVVAAQGKLAAAILTQNTTINRSLIADTSLSAHVSDPNRGNLLTENDAQWNSVSVGRGSNVTGSRSVGVGFNAKVETGAPAIDDCVAVGYESFVTGGKSVSIGSGTRGTPSGVAIGYNVKAGSSDTATESGIVAIGSELSVPGSLSTVVGQGITATGTGATVFGQAAKTNGGAAFGRGADATGTNAVAIGNFAESLGFAGVSVGRDAEASGAYSAAIGYQASSSGNNSVSIGRTASATHTDSVSIGANTASQRANSVCVGNRDIESTKVGGGIFLKSPNGTLYKIAVSDGGSLTVTAV